MSRAKVFTSILMVLILIALSGASVWAAPGGQEPEEPPDGGPPTVHPVASALAEFFNELLDLPPDSPTIMDYHGDGWGFGVIAQACWMSVALTGDATSFGDILEAKKSHNFDSITLPDDIEETPKNWGQFKKVVLGSKKAQRNLGEIMSGRAEPPDETGGDELGAAANQGQGKGKKGKGTSEKDGALSAESPGKGKGKGGKPEAPPGKENKGGGGKGKGKDK